MKLYINKNKFLTIIAKELPNQFVNRELDKLSLLNSKSVHLEKQKYNFFTFQEIFKIKANNKISLNKTDNVDLIKLLNKKLKKQFYYLGSKKNYSFNIEQIFNKNDNLVVEFKFYRK